MAAAVLKMVLAILVSWALGAWSMMITVGVAHADWWPLIPLMSFHVALALFGIVILVGIAVGVLKVVFGLADD